MKKIVRSFDEAKFGSGSRKKVLMAIASRMKKQGYDFDIDLDITDSFSTPQGDMEGFYVYIDGDRELRINFRLDSNSDVIASVDLIPANASYEKPSETIVFSDDVGNREITQAIGGLIDGNLQESFEKKNTVIERSSPAKTAILNWLNDPEFMDARLDIIQDERLSHVYSEYVRTTDGRPVSQAAFINTIKEFLQNNGMKNAYTRVAYTRKTNQKVTSIVSSGEAPTVKAIASTSPFISTWREAFEDMEDDFEELMDDPTRMPFGQIVYGNGGTGKSFFYNETKDSGKYKMEIIKGAPNLSRLIKILYDYKDHDVIVFDDADSVITTNNSANILKMALDDTAANIDPERRGRRVIYLPKGSGKDLQGIQTDVFDSDGNPVEAFYFSASVVVITNLPDIKDKALKTRCYLNPIFMSKTDIIEKISETVDPSDFGVTPMQVRLVMDAMVTLIESGDFDITDDQLSYRFFKIALKLIKQYPDRWIGKLYRKLGIGIKTSYADLDTKRRKRASTQRNKKPISENTVVLPSNITLNFEDREIILEKGDTIKVLS